MNFKIAALIVVLLLSTIFADSMGDCGFTPTATLNGRTFYITQPNTSYSCSVSNTTVAINNVRGVFGSVVFSDSITEVYATGTTDPYVSILNLTGNFTKNISCSVFNLAATYFSNDSFSSSLACVGVGGCGGAASATANISLFNSTHYIVYTPSGNITFTGTQGFSIKATKDHTGACGGSTFGNLNVPTLNASDFTEMNTTDFLAGSSTPMWSSSFTSPFRMSMNNLGGQNYFLRMYGSSSNAAVLFNSSEAGRYNATLVQTSGSSTMLVLPSICYETTTETAYPFCYDNTSQIVSLKNNTPTYVFDPATSSWFFCPAYAATAPVIYTITCVSVPFSSGTSGNISKIYPIQNCYTSNNNFTWNLKATESTIFTYQKVYTNATGGIIVENAVTTAIQYTGTTNITNTTNITISDSNGVICAYQNGSSIILSDIPFLSTYNLTKVAGTFVWVSFMAIGAFAPPALIGAVITNDVLSIFPVTTMFVFLMLPIAISFVVNYSGEKGLKTIGMYIALGLGILTYYAMIAPSLMMTGGEWIPELSAISELSTQFVDLNNALATANPLALILPTASFIITICGIILKLPLILASLIFSPLILINLNLYNAATPLRAVVSVGMYMWVGVKVFEVLSNRFRNI